jgi:type IV secretory pathway VirJ component
MRDSLAAHVLALSRAVTAAAGAGLRYYWAPRTTEAAARNLARIGEHYSVVRKKERVLLVGYSFGA